MRLPFVFRQSSWRGRFSLVLVAGWAVFSLASVGSHRTYELASVAVFVITVGVLAVVLGARPALRMPKPPASAVPVAMVALGSVLIFQPSYMPADQAFAMRLTVLVCTLAICVLWLQNRFNPLVPSLGLTGVVAAVTAWFPIRGVPVPGNDVWYLLQQSNEGLVRGENMYRMTWKGVPPGQVTDVFTYPPMSSVLMAPARWLTGDVRWGLAFLVLLSALLLLLAARTAPGEAPALWFAPACLLVLTPGHPLQVEMSWTEPLLLFLLLAALVATVRKRSWAAIGFLALALASKQHVWVLVPLFVAWRQFGPRRVGLAILGAVLLCLPWIVADPQAMYADVVGSYLGSGSSTRSSTLSILLDRLGLELPLVLAVCLLALAVLYCCYRLQRPDATAAEFCLAAALTLLVANLLNKQAYYNQWWLVGSLVLAALAFRSPPRCRGEDQDLTGGASANAPA